MNLSYYLATFYNLNQNIDLCIRLLVACVVGAIIGIERSSRFKEAGVRTHILVCCTAALIMILSKYGFADLASTGDITAFGSRGVDAARIAAQAVSGISFLCAGVIFKNGNNTIRGLTTAAGIWMTAGLGLTIGAGMYVIAGCAFVLVCILQPVMHYFKVGSDAYAGYGLEFNVKNDQGFNEAMVKQLDEWGAIPVEHKISWNEDGTSQYSLYVMRKNELSYEEILNFVKSRDDVISFSTSLMKKDFH
ncbi:MAG: MgtC/SapB family protein [Lachnospiraceae bacterium]|nr:MgtC/SapB family protein [Lachnospiraceae bacterium]